MAGTGPIGGDTTVLPDDLSRDLGVARAASSRPAVVLAWSRQEPARVGELILLPGGPTPGTTILGRGEALDDDPHPRGKWARQRPGPLEWTGPLESPALSRRQLELTPVKGGLKVVRTGRVPLIVRGEEVDEAVVAPGEGFAVEGQLLLIHERRPERIPRSTSFPRSRWPEFGAPDDHGQVGESPAAWATRDRLAWVAARRPHVLVLGESGTGKELAAGAIHAMSERGGRTLVARNAATFPEGLVDAELFGNIKDYPNPGMAERSGLVGEANGTTLFLDEIAELPERLQAHLLRVLDDGEYQRLGESRARRSDFRLVAATNRPAGDLKHDLLARLKMRVELPGLGDRTSDVPLLARHLVKQIAAQDPGIGAKFSTENGEPRFTQALMQRLLEHRWTHHVRELDAALWASIGSSTGSRLELTADVKRELDRQTGSFVADVAPAELTEEAIRESMQRHQGVRERVWRELGLKNRWALGRLLKKHGIES